jgi:hypothetical protein
VPDPTSELGLLICAETCVNPGGACTTAADCCNGSACNGGVCGQAQGCAEYGQGCTMTSDCCNADLGITCQNGLCLGQLQ